MFRFDANRSKSFTSQSCPSKEHWYFVLESDSFDHQMILEQMIKKNPKISQLAGRQPRFLRSLTSTAWLAQEYSHAYATSPTDDVEVDINGGSIQLRDLARMLEKRFKDLITEQLVLQKEEISGATATMFNLLHTATLLKAKQPLDKAFKSTIADLMSNSEDEFNRAITTVRNLVNALDEGSPLAYFMAKGIRQTIATSNAGHKVKLIETYDGLIPRFEAGHGEETLGALIMHQEMNGEGSVAVQTAAGQALQNLQIKFPHVVASIATTTGILPTS